MDFGSARGIYIVLDATEISRDWYMSGLEFRLLRFLAREAGVRPVVPPSVVAESVANHGREYAATRRALLKAATDFGRSAGPNRISLDTIPVDMGYEVLLAQRFEDLGVEVLDFPKTSHADIVARAVSRRPPFDSTGSGYRDTLTWMSCMALATEGAHVFLVSQDKDFAGKDLDLAPALQGEVDAAPGSVTLVRHMGKWLTSLVPWQGVTDPREAAAMARDEEVAAFFAPWDRFETELLTAEELGLPADTEIVDTTYYGSGGIERLGHERLPGGADRITYRFDIDFEVEYLPGATELSRLDAASGGRSPESITTVISLDGVMTVVHDERDLSWPYGYETFTFRNAAPVPAEPPQTDVDQLEFPIDD